MLGERELISKAAEAADEVLGYYGIEKALNPLKYRDYLSIVGRLTNALKGVTRDAEAAAIRRALNTLDVDWANMGEEATDRVVDAARGALQLRQDLLPGVEDVLVKHGTRIVQGTRQAVKRSLGLKIPVDLNRVDQNVIRSSSTMQVNFVRDAAGKRQDAFSQRARSIVADGLERGLGRADIGAALSADLTALMRTDSYWTMVASSHAGRSRSYSNLSSMEMGGIEKFQFVSVLDENTSVVCRFMHNRVFEVKGSLSRYVAAAELDDPEDIKDHQPWLQVGLNEKGEREVYYKLRDGTRRAVAEVATDASGRRDDQGAFRGAVSDAALQKAGISTPPLHGRCRSTIVAM